MAYEKNYLNRTYWQLALVFIVVFVIGLYRNGKAKNKEKEQEMHELSLPDRLEPQIALEASYEIPDLFYGSDEKWEKSAKDIDDETIILVGEGWISNHKVITECKYNIIDGSLTGRYHNENGTELDLNGQVSLSGDELEIHLGHKSDKTFSKWILYPKESETKNGTYVYSGYWGESKKPSEITFTVK